MASRCSGSGCDGREDGAVEALLQWQKVSDFLIGASYMSIPLVLLHFATCADLAPLRGVLLQFGAFIVLCGLVHLVGIFTYARPDSRRLLLAFTSAKAAAALAASVAAVSLPTFIPQLLRLKTREALLRDKARQLDRDVALVRRRQETAARVFRAITHHIRRGVGGGGGHLPHDALAVLRTAVLHLSDALGLRSCAVWMPAAANELHLVHQVPEEDDRRDKTATARRRQAINDTDPDVAAVMASKDAKVLRPGSVLGTTSGSGNGPAAAIRMPMLRASNFVDASSSGSDEQTGGSVSYAVMVMVMVLPAPPPAPKNRRGNRRNRGGTGGAREWSKQELEIAEVVADQLAVSLSHAAVLEEWQLTRYKLAERQRAVAQAQHDAAVAGRAMDAAQAAMRDSVLRPMHPVVGLLSLMQAQQQQDDAFPCAEQRLAVAAMARLSALSSTLIDDVMAAVTTTSRGGDPASAGVSLARRPFDLRALVRDAAAVAGGLARWRGLGFSHRAETSSLPAECRVVGDERRVFHLLLHMLGALLDRCECHCHDLCFCVEAAAGGEQDPANSSGCNMVCVKFLFGITRTLRDSLVHSSSPRPRDRITKGTSNIPVNSETRLSIATCNKIAQMMNGKMWRESPSDFGAQQHGESMNLILHFQLGYGLASPSTPSPSGGGGFFYRSGGGSGIPSPSLSTIPHPPQYHFDGLRVLLADSDDTSREVTRKLLERLGCHVLPVPSAAHCLSLLQGSDTAAADQPPYLQLQVVLLDLHTTPDATASATDDRFEVAIRIRELASDSFSWLPILVALPLPPRGSCIDDARRDVCQRAGVNGVIHKPITLPALGAQLCRVLHNGD